MPGEGKERERISWAFWLGSGSYFTFCQLQCLTIQIGTTFHSNWGWKKKVVLKDPLSPSNKEHSRIFQVFSNAKYQWKASSICAPCLLSGLSAYNQYQAQRWGGLSALHGISIKPRDMMQMNVNKCACFELLSHFRDSLSAIDLQYAEHQKSQSEFSTIKFSNSNLLQASWQYNNTSISTT